MGSSFNHREKLRCKKEEEIKKEEGFIQVFESS
jgi:hypothetical protein